MKISIKILLGILLCYAQVNIHVVYAQSKGDSATKTLESSALKKDCLSTYTLKQAQKNHYFAVLDHDHIMQTATAALKARQEIEAQRSLIQDQINQYEQKLRIQKENLVTLQTTLTEEEYLQKRQDFEKDVTRVQQIVSKRKSELEESFNHVREVIVAKILKIVEQIACERHYTLVLPKSMIFYADRACDMTELVLQQLNHDLTYVDLNQKDYPHDD